MKKIYHLSSCSTCKRILSALNLEGVELQDIKTQALTEQQLSELYAISGCYESLFSRRAQKYKSMGLADQDLKDQDFKKYLLLDYTFLKRPVALIEGDLFVGNSKKVVEALAERLKA